ncbi:Formin-like protein 13 [Phytophthora citrophthora]|uniref:Formin-like protein 13 n=1 Tax=Phytophthora citrophthora TaxID=4793 RepID=A0AAD9GQ91_9STRA|nr:Formin-like protein 13 [Phytophthora citrophthora]
MESLRRLTSSVLDAGPVRLVRRASMGDVRPPDARSLELTFMTERLVVCGAPCDAPTDKKGNVVNADDLVQYLDEQHRGRYLLFNLNALEGVQETEEGHNLLSLTWRASLDEDGRESVADRLHEQMLEFNWERDGMKAHTPPFDLIFRLCYALDAWLSLDPQNVALINCQTGKTRSGVVVACYLLFSGLADDPTDAFVEFYRKRWEMKSLTPQALKKKTPPSIQRFLSGFHELLEKQKPPNEKPLLLKAVIFRQLPVELQPCVQIWDDYKLVFCTDGLQAVEGEAPVLDWNEEDGFFAILWENGVELDGGFSILCSFGEDYDNVDDVDASSRVLFRYADSTLFLLPGLVTLKKHDLDLMKQYEHGFDEDQFSVDLVLHENSAKKARNSVRMNCTGNSAVRQGLIEITKHHVVLPDPAMHSNFIRMGFCETPTTFALQCSQNAPNVALDLLHSKGLSACFAQEATEAAAETEEPGKSTGDNQSPSPTTESDQQPALRRQTTAEIVAMQSKRSRYSIPTATDSSLCDTCKEDDYMMRPQVVQCAGRCGKYYHTTCVGLRKIPFGLTTMSDRTNHAVYVKKFFSAWECDACAPKSPIAAINLPNGEIPSNMKLVPASWVGSEPDTASANPQDVDSNARDVIATASSTEEPHAAIEENAPKEFNQLKDFLATNGLSIEDLMKAATTPSTSTTSVAISLANTLASSVVSNSPKVDVKAALFSELKTARKASDASEVSTANGEDNKYTLMLKRGVPFEAVQNCMKKDGVDPSTLKPLSPNDGAASDGGAAVEAAGSQKTKLKDVTEYASYFRMLRMGCPKEAVKQKVTMDGLDPIIIDLGPEAIYDEVKNRIAVTQGVSKLQDDIKSVKATSVADSASEVLLKDHEVYAKYFKMLKMGLPEGAVRQKMKADGVNERALDLGGDTPFSKLPKSDEKKAATASVKDVMLKDDPKYAKYFKMLQMGLPEGAVRQKMKADGVDERALDLGGDTMVSQLAGPVGGDVKLQDDPTYSKYFKMLKMGLPQGAVRQKMKTEGVDERALDLGGDAYISELIAMNNDVKLQDDPVYSKYFKMLKMGLPEGAVKHKMVTENVDVRALELGPDATVSQLSPGGDSKTVKKAVALKPKRARKKLHWQPISVDRLSNLNQQTIWEDEDDDVDFDMDMDELEALFFANQNTGSGKNNSSRVQSKALKRKQAVTLIDGKRAMNAAISLARVKLSYTEIAEAVMKFDPSGLTIEQLVGINEFLPTSEEAALVSGYTGDIGMLGEAEKFILEIAKVKRYAPRMEGLVYKLSFTPRSAELAASLAHLQKAGEEVKGSRLLKTLLAMVLKLGNTLNGSGEENGIKGFTVDSLLRLGHTKAVNQKTTVLHYLVRLVKKNHPQVLDFQAELRSVPFAARESFDTIDEEFKKLEKGLASLNTELGLLEKQAVESVGVEITIKAMRTAALDIEAQMKAMADEIARAKEEVSSVLDYFGEDPKRNPTEFFTTLASFCSVFQRARREVDAADEAAQRAERLKMRRTNSLRPPAKSNNGAALKSRPILERSQTSVEKPDDN